MNDNARLSASTNGLRRYQRQCLERLRQRYREGKRRLLVSLPTDTGKTVIFAQFPHYFRMKKRLLVLAHREELLEQARQKFHDADPHLPVEIEQAGKRASAHCKVVIASVPTIGRASRTCWMHGRSASTRRGSVEEGPAWALPTTCPAPFTRPRPLSKRSAAPRFASSICRRAGATNRPVMPSAAFSVARAFRFPQGSPAAKHHG